MSTVIITGASMGIGRALALAWAGEKATVILSARGREALDEVASEVASRGARAVVVPGDVTDEEYRVDLVRHAVEHGGVDVLINNAGRGFYSPALQIDVAKLRELFELNVVALPFGGYARSHVDRHHHRGIDGHRAGIGARMGRREGDRHPLSAW
ncbi:MAG: short-chain dehydrogenase/reductase, partial [Labilithrix sp.]|nr:short-chain dehydrogenase/reductase [Labilithrix sp.]